MNLTSNQVQIVLFPNRFVEKFFWELTDSSFIAVEVRLLMKDLQSDSASDETSKITKKEEPPTHAPYLNDSRLSGKQNSRSPLSRNSRLEQKLKTEQSEEKEEESVPIVDLPSEVDHAVVTMFADIDKGFLVHEKRIDLVGKSLVGLEVPYVYLAENGAWKNKKPMLKDTKHFGVSFRLSRDIMYTII